MQVHVFINWYLKYYGTEKNICGCNRKKVTWDLRLSNMMNNLLPVGYFIYLFLNS